MWDCFLFESVVIQHVTGASSQWTTLPSSPRVARGGGAGRRRDVRSELQAPLVELLFGTYLRSDLASRCLRRVVLLC